jgi:hypothetical protein
MLFIHFLKSTLRYNVHRPPPSGAFKLNVTHYELSEGSCSRGRHIKMCARYDSGSSPSDASSSSNMVLVELSLISGYEANKQSLDALVVRFIITLEFQHIRSN